jgi:hypothetical protein
MDNLRTKIKMLEQIHGGTRAASRATGVDPGYLVRLREGKKTNPSEATLKKLGLRKEVIYVFE